MCLYLINASPILLFLLTPVLSLLTPEKNIWPLHCLSLTLSVLSETTDNIRGKSADTEQYFKSSLEPKQWAKRLLKAPEVCVIPKFYQSCLQHVIAAILDNARSYTRCTIACLESVPLAVFLLCSAKTGRGYFFGWKPHQVAHSRWSQPGSQTKDRIENLVNFQNKTMCAESRSCFISPTDKK